jgi:hypothetical protein
MVTLEFEKISGVNNGYIIRHGFRSKAQASINFQNAFKFAAIKFKKDFLDFNEKDNYIEVEMFWYNPSYFKKDGSMNKKAVDIDAPLKFILDGLCEGIGLDDSFVKQLNVKQMPSETKLHKICVMIYKRSLKIDSI